MGCLFTAYIKSPTMKKLSLFLFFLAAFGINSCKKGATGPEGPEGPAGPQGGNATNQIVKVMSYGVSDIAASLAVANGAVIPINCRTPEYTANEGEIAIIHMDANLLPNPVVNSVVFVSVGISTNGGTSFTSNNTTQSMDNLSDGMASSSISLVMPLVAGTKYVFGTTLLLSAGSASFARSSSHATVMIVKIQ